MRRISSEMILDTSYLIDLLEREQPAFEKGMELYRNGVATRVSMASVFELFYVVEAGSPVA